MADLSPFSDRLNDIEISNNAPITTTLMRRIGQNINYLLDLLNVPDGSNTPIGGGIVEFTTPGNYNYTVQPGLTRFWLLAVAGGGGGGSPFIGAGSQASGGGGGAISQLYLESSIGDELSITVGAGGAALPYPSLSEDGGNTIVSTSANNFYVAVQGGKAGLGQGFREGGAGGGYSESDDVLAGAPTLTISTTNGGKGGDTSGGRGQNGRNTPYAKGGDGSPFFGTASGSGGGGASYGRGGNAGYFLDPNGGQGYNGVQGGGGGGGQNKLGPSGGNGGDGLVKIIIPLIT